MLESVAVTIFSHSTGFHSLLPNMYDCFNGLALLFLAFFVLTLVKYASPTEGFGEEASVSGLLWYHRCIPTTIASVGLGSGLFLMNTWSQDIEN